MKTKSNSGLIEMAALTVGVLTLSIAASGCRMPGRVLSTESSAVCPECQTETRTAPVKGVTYQKHICPGCGAVAVTSAPLQADSDPGWTVHVCDRCKALVTKCPQCQAQ